MGTECYLISLDRKEAYCVGKNRKGLFPFALGSGYDGDYLCFKDGKFTMSDCYSDRNSLFRMLMNLAIRNYGLFDAFSDGEISRHIDYLGKLATDIYEWAGNDTLMWKGHVDGWSEEDFDIINNHQTGSAYSNKFNEVDE